MHRPPGGNAQDPLKESGSPGLQPSTLHSAQPPSALQLRLTRESDRRAQPGGNDSSSLPDSHSSGAS